MVISNTSDIECMLRDYDAARRYLAEIRRKGMTIELPRARQEYDRARQAIINRFETMNREIKRLKRRTS